MQDTQWHEAKVLLPGFYKFVKGQKAYVKAHGQQFLLFDGDAHVMVVDPTVAHKVLRIGTIAREQHVLESRARFFLSLSQ